MSRRQVCHCCVGEARDFCCQVCDVGGSGGVAFVKATILKETNVGYAASSDAPVPPAGDVEVLGYKFNFARWISTEGPQGWRLEFDTEKPAQFLFDDGRVKDYVELVDRANVTRLEERCGRLDYDYVTVQADLREMTAERDGLLAELCARAGQIGSLAGERDAAQSELTKARGLLNTPHTDEWFEGVRLEAGHQIGRWGADHDASKAPADWFWLIGYLAQKAMTAHMAGNEGKARHHTISTGAAMLNWFRAIVGDSNAMRPGHEHGICQKCNDTGEVDSGGVHPWGDAIKIPCDCQPATPATPAAHNVDESCGQDAEAAKGAA